MTHDIIRNLTKNTGYKTLCFIALGLVLAFMPVGCSTKKPTPTTRVLSGKATKKGAAIANAAFVVKKAAANSSLWGRGWMRGAVTWEEVDTGTTGAAGEITAQIPNDSSVYVLDVEPGDGTEKISAVIPPDPTPEDGAQPEFPVNEVSDTIVEIAETKASDGDMDMTDVNAAADVYFGTLPGLEDLTLDEYYKLAAEIDDNNGIAPDDNARAELVDLLQETYEELTDGERDAVATDCADGTLDSATLAILDAAAEDAVAGNSVLADVSSVDFQQPVLDSTSDTGATDENTAPATE